ncbi:MAG TPA: ABC transporter ATP-binding protein [Lacipirellulaceae bacterium]|nr:ABC transporter ATP-binding protein [Lacipirellulaceae bacterium]
MEVVDVAKRYSGGALAVEGLSMTLRPGEFVSLVGPSGCGKSTALRLVAGLSQPTTGVVRRPDRTRSASRGGGVGCAFQDPTLMPWASAEANVALPLRLAGQRRAVARQAAREALAQVGLASFARAYPRQLSGGMRMRVALARALVTQPELVLLDEPLAALDEMARHQLHDDLHALWAARRWTGLLITHSVAEAAYLSTRVLVMSPRPGRILSEIPVDLPQPRTASLRTSTPFVRLVQRIADCLSGTANPPKAAAGREGQAS